MKTWVEDQGYQYEIWQDVEKTLAIYYGAAIDDGTLFPQRISVLLDSEGQVILEYLQPSVSTHPAKVLEDCQTIFGQ